MKDLVRKKLLESEDVQLFKADKISTSPDAIEKYLLHLCSLTRSGYKNFIFIIFYLLINFYLKKNYLDKYK